MYRTTSASYTHADLRNQTIFRGKTDAFNRAYHAYEMDSYITKLEALYDATADLLDYATQSVAMTLHNPSDEFLAINYQNNFPPETKLAIEKAMALIPRNVDKSVYRMLRTAMNPAPRLEIKREVAQIYDPRKDYDPGHPNPRPYYKNQPPIYAPPPRRYATNHRVESLETPEIKGRDYTIIAERANDTLARASSLEKRKWCVDLAASLGFSPDTKITHRDLKEYRSQVPENQRTALKTIIESVHVDRNHFPALAMLATGTVDYT